jgi:hypothetical protein
VLLDVAEERDSPVAGSGIGTRRRGHAYVARARLDRRGSERRPSTARGIVRSQLDPGLDAPCGQELLVRDDRGEVHAAAAPRSVVERDT